MKAMTMMTMMTTLLPSIAISAFAEHFCPDTQSNYKSSTLPLKMKPKERFWDSASNLPCTIHSRFFEHL